MKHPAVKPSAILLALLAFALALAFFLYPLMPERMASHWNAAGEVNGFMDKLSFHLFIFGLLVFMAGLFYVVPKIDPLKKNLASFIKYYWGFVYLIFVFMVYVYLLSAAANLGWQFSMTLVLMPALSALFFYLGWILPKLKRNWFIGVRTPWTLSSDKVWAETHRLGGKVFFFIGFLFLLLMFAPLELFLPVIALVVLAGFGLMAYSYFLYRKLEKK